MRIAPLKPDFIHCESRIAHTTTEATKKKQRKLTTELAAGITLPIIRK